MAHSSCLRLEIDNDFPEQRKILRTINILDRGGIIAYPTDTAYGIGCSIFEKHGIDRIYRLKGLAQDHMLSIICPDLADIARYAIFDNQSFKLMKRYLPGPYTFILKATSEVPKIFQSKRKTVGIRVPNHPVTLALTRAYRKPIVSTSTMINTRCLNNADEINTYLGHGLDLILDSGDIADKQSSIVDLSGPYPNVIRQGAGDLSWLQV